MLETRFTQERMNKIQGYLNEIGRVKHEANDDFKIFVDRVGVINEDEVIYCNE